MNQGWVRYIKFRKNESGLDCIYHLRKNGSGLGRKYQVEEGWSRVG